MLASADVFTQLQPRNVSRRERKPGARERHSLQRERLGQCQKTETLDTIPQKLSIPQPQPVRYNKTSYCMDSAVSEFGGRREKENEISEQPFVTSRYKELTTIEDIRANMKATARRQHSAPPKHIPNWMLNLDIHLDVSVSDIIPPFDEDANNKSEKDKETYNESASLIFLENTSDDEADDVYGSLHDGEQVYSSKVHQLDTEKTMSSFNTQRSNIIQMHAPSQSSKSPSRNIERPVSSRKERRPMSNTFRIAGTFSPGAQDKSSPRRYQGDKRVMSLQQGGIRSTPFQPKAKKFINQMITFRHMKHHDRKIKIAKPAIDTRMPETFKIALERKHLVEHRLSDSWNRSNQTPTPTKSSFEHPKSEKSTRWREP